MSCPGCAPSFQGKAGEQYNLPSQEFTWSHIVSY